MGVQFAYNLLKMNNELLKQLASLFKVSEEKVTEAYNESVEFVNKQFPNASEAVKANKIMTMASTKFRTTMSANTSNYTGIVIGVGPIQDSNNYQRNAQLKLYNDTLKTAEESGDMSSVESLHGVVVNIGEDGNPIALYPFYKADGTESKMAGKEIPTPENSFIRELYGIAYAEGKDAEKDMQIFKMQLKGKALNNIPPIGKIVSFKAGGKEYKGELQLNSSVTDFVEVSDKYLEEGIAAIGVDGVVDQYFKEKIVDYKTIQEWVDTFKADPSKSPVPKELRYNYVVIPNNNCMTQNFEPNDKGKCTLTFCADEFSMDTLITIIAGATPEIANKIEFTANSTCTIVGQISIFGKPDEEPMIYFTLMGAIPKKDMWIPRIKAEPLVEEKSTTAPETKEEVKDEKPVTKAW